MIINGVGSRVLVDFLKFNTALRNINDCFCKSLFMILFLIPAIEFFEENSMRISIHLIKVLTTLILRYCYRLGK